MPKPTPEDQKNPLFDPIWLAIRGRKLECAEYYEGWQIATGEHVKIIINQLKEVIGANQYVIMDKQTYTQRVQALAEKMAIDHFEKHIAPSDRAENGWDGLTNEQKKIWVEAELSRACIAVAEMAALYERLYNELQVGDNKIIGFNNAKGQYQDYRTGMDEILKEQGLIPDNAPGGLQPGEPGYGGYNPDNPPPFCGQMCETCGEESETTSWRESHSAAMCDICYSKYAQEGAQHENR